MTILSTSGPFHLFVVDEPDPECGANHEYEIRSGETVHTRIQFQHGPIAKVGPNGVPDVLLARILQHRLQGFQSGPHASQYNDRSLTAIGEYIAAQEARTETRQAQGVEGTSAPHVEGGTLDLRNTSKRAPTKMELTHARAELNRLSTRRSTPMSTPVRQRPQCLRGNSC